MTVKNQWDMHNIDNNERNEYGTYGTLVSFPHKNGFLIRPLTFDIDTQR
jgi:hypothetical protein